VKRKGRKKERKRVFKQIGGEKFVTQRGEEHSRRLKRKKENALVTSHSEGVKKEYDGIEICAVEEKRVLSRRSGLRRKKKKVVLLYQRQETPQERKRPVQSSEEGKGISPISSKDKEKCSSSPLSPKKTVGRGTGLIIFREERAWKKRMAAWACVQVKGGGRRIGIFSPPTSTHDYGEEGRSWSNKLEPEG